MSPRRETPDASPPPGRVVCPACGGEGYGVELGGCDPCSGRGHVLDRPLPQRRMKTGLWSFTFRLPDGTLPSKQLAAEPIYSTTARGRTREDAERAARVTVARKSGAATGDLACTGSAPEDWTAHELDGTTP